MLRPPAAQNGSKLGRDLTIDVILMHAGIEAQRTNIGAAMTGVNDNTGTADRSRRIVEFKRKYIAVIACRIAAHTVGFAERQRQRIP